ncbi:MAG: GlsB/YeaQ/YmgE family stress response membrane protein [Ktedonobacteraceae bacterium]|nr:GlsB/YeaQ/YmgE family stress response membrane protein [Ktedonobacteraceae bacterium]
MMMILADGITVQIGNNVWTFGLNTLLYLLIAAVVGLVAEYIVGWRVPLGIIGAIIAALVGIWLTTQVIVITGVGDVMLYGVPLIRALIGAILFVAIWHLITFGLTRRRYQRVA